MSNYKRNTTECKTTIAGCFVCHDVLLLCLFNLSLLRVKTASVTNTAFQGGPHTYNNFFLQNELYWLYCRYNQNHLPCNLFRFSRVGHIILYFSLYLNSSHQAHLSHFWLIFMTHRTQILCTIFMKMCLMSQRIFMKMWLKGNLITSIHPVIYTCNQSKMGFQFNTLLYSSSSAKNPPYLFKMFNLYQYENFNSSINYMLK